LLLLAPVVIGGTMVLAAPQAARAGGGMTETGTTTYEVIPGKSLIQVTIQISIHNDSPNETNGGSVTIYYWNSTSIMVEQAAGPVTAASDAGRVTANTGSSDQYYKVVKLNYPGVYYGQTRVVTATYTIPGALNARDNFRVGQAYASLCAVGNGQDKGSVSVIVPDGYLVHDIVGGQLTKTNDLGAKQVYSSGPLTNPYKFATCVQATNPANLTHTALTSGSQTFDLQGWPEDSTWSTAVRGDVSGDFQRLEDLTGLKGPAGTVVVAETGGGLNDDGVTYDPATKTVGIPEGAAPNVVAHALAHVWFNPTMFKDTWLSEGLAGYGQKAAGEGSYTPCTEPGVYPASGPPDLTTWRTLNFNSTTQDQNVSDWQYSASCYFFTTLANAMGPDAFRSFLKAADGLYRRHSGREARRSRAAPHLAPGTRPARRARHAQRWFDRPGPGPEAAGGLGRLRSGEPRGTLEVAGRIPRPGERGGDVEAAAGRPRPDVELGLCGGRRSHGHRPPDSRCPRLDWQGTLRFLARRYSHTEAVRVGGDSGRSR
jgi:hypothetical protein